MIERLDRLEQENRQIAEQLDRLKRAHRFWKRTAGLVGLGAMLLIVAAPAFPPQAQVPFIVHDPTGRPRFEMNVENEKTFLKIRGSEGNEAQIELLVSDRQPATIYFRDPQGNILRRVP
jgi:hypothetical protein